MEIIKTAFRHLFVVKSTVWTDDRGSFQETFKEASFRIATGLNLSFVQDNESVSKKGVLRGMHAQKPPRSQGKLIRVVQGAIQDVVVDLRKSEATFGQWISFDLKQGDGQMIYVPEGFAHGFLALEENTIVNYKCTNYYDRESEIHINPFDPQLAIEWKDERFFQSEKDTSGKSFADFDNLFF
jgi:dTDP-4-dehydrorhamnose 3,5-epimerase